MQNFKIPKKNYFIDDSNKFILKSNGKHIILEGDYDIDRNNNLIFSHPESALDNTTSKIKLSGNWQLTDNYDMKLILDADNSTNTPADNSPEEIILKGEIVNTNSTEINFAVNYKLKDGRTRTKILKFGGYWRTDENNKLLFSLTTTGTKNNSLEFKSAWEIGENYEIIYKYKKQNLRRKTKIEHSLILKGVWNISQKNKIEFLVDMDSRSTLNFEASFKTASLYPKEGELRYEIGIKGAPGENFKTIIRNITLFGTWKFSKTLGLGFETTYKDGRKYTMKFSAEINNNHSGKNPLTPDEITISILNTHGESLGAEFTVSKNLSKNIAASIRLLKSSDERGVYIGVKGRF